MRRLLMALGLLLMANPAHAYDTDWDSFTRRMASLPGARFPNGELRVTHECHPETNHCAIVLGIVDDGYRKFQLMEFRDINDKIVSKWTCKFNRYGTMISCENFDTHEITSSVIVNGHWVESKQPTTTIDDYRSTTQR